MQFLVSFLDGFKDDPRQARWDTLFVVLICAVLVAFCYWQAVPIPEVLP